MKHICLCKFGFVHGKNDFAKISKNLARYRSENVGPSKYNYYIWAMLQKNFNILVTRILYIIILIVH